MSFRKFLGAALFLAASTAAHGQQFPFRLLATQGSLTTTVSNGATLAMTSPQGDAATVRITATYTGAGTASITSGPVIAGSQAFRATLTSELPVTLTPGASIAFDIEFLPSGAAASAAQLGLPFVETIPGSGGGDPVQVPNAITLGLQGTSPLFVFSYVLPADQNVVPIQAGGTIPFPSTLVNTSTTAALNLTNIGNGPGIVASIAISGDGFRLTGLPFLPLSLDGSQNLQVGIVYQPRSIGTSAGQVTITLAGGAVTTINLTGTSTATRFTYEILDADPPTAIQPGGRVTFADTAVGETARLVVRIRNAGPSDGTIGSIAVSGAGFQLSDGPVLPQLVPPGGTLAFTLNFTPTQPEDLNGLLFVNTDTFQLTGRGLGSRLVYSYLVGGTRITLGGSTASIVFSPVTITQSATLTFSIRNTGSAAALISNIGANPTGGPFTVAGLPALPLTIDPNTEIQLPVTFAPVALGFANGSLLVDTTTIGLVGSGTTPPPLPSYTISGPAGNATPGAQSSVRLTLSQPYPAAVSGTLTLGISGDLPSDPAVQFSTGGRAVPFVVPANRTEAIFAGQGAQVGLQTGTVAGDITLTPVFATQAGGVDLTPADPAVLRFTVQRAAPVLAGARITNVTGNGFTLSLTGFTTSRNLTSLQVQFTPVAGVSFPSSQFTINVAPVADAWFRTAASQTFGGQFTMSVPFTFQGSLPNGGSAVSAIASVSATVSNGSGASNAVQASPQ